MEELLELIALVYWQANKYCGGNFDDTCFCSCRNYEFCKKYNEVKAAIIQAEKAEKTWKS
jgi:hypothetical protein